MAPKRMRRLAGVVDRRRVRPRPAMADSVGDGWIQAHELELKEIRGMKAVHIQGKYWDNEAEVVGEFTSLLMGEDGAWVTCQVHGTSTEAILKFISGQTRAKQRGTNSRA